MNRAAQLERGWHVRTPRPALNAFIVPEGGEASHRITESLDEEKGWYKVVGTPPDEEVVWFAPFRASYVLYATKSGKVVWWDVHRDVSQNGTLANSGDYGSVK